MPVDDTSSFVRLGETFCRAFSRASREPAGHAMTEVQLDGLRFIASHPGCHVKDVAAGLRVSHPAATKLLDRLVARRALARVPGDQDRREVHLALRAAGEAALAADREARARSFATILERMAREDRLALEAGLQAYLRAALRTPEDVDAVCGRCGTEHEPACPLEGLDKEMGRAKGDWRPR
jgi:DNA-binding MarR family transcriptional regulator